MFPLYFNYGMFDPYLLYANQGPFNLQMNANAMPSNFQYDSMPMGLHQNYENEKLQ